MTLKIVDVSSHQGNYLLGSNGEDGAIVKATQGTGYVNPNCDFVAQQALKQGKPWGLYHYAGGGDAIAEADYFLKVASKYLAAPNKPVLILDWEAYQNNAYGNGAWAELFLKRIKTQIGIQAGIYGNSGDLSQMTKWVCDNAWLWFAGYPSSVDVGWSPIPFPYSLGKFKKLTGWQFSATPLDKSHFYITKEEWLSLAGCRVGANSQETKPKTKETEEEIMKIIKLPNNATYYLVRSTGVTTLTAQEWIGVKRVLGFKDSDVDTVNQAEFDGIKSALGKK